MPFLLVRPAECVQASPLKPGARVRFDAPGVGTRLTGTVVAWESDTLTVKVDGDATGLATMVSGDSLTRLDVQREHRMTVEGFFLGGLAGTLLAVLASPDLVDDNGQCTTIGCLAYQVSPHTDTRVAVLGGLGALLGTILGSETKTVGWARVPLNGGGVALGLRVSF